jgi:hypothetical protein
MSTYSIETDYGYWVPKVYVGYIGRKLEESSGPRRHALEKRGQELQRAGKGYVRGQIQIYLDAVEQRIGSGDRALRQSANQKEAICEKILRRVRHLTNLLTHQKALERLSQTWVGAPVPEFWEDEASVARFFDGFCYDIVTRLNAPGNVPAIVMHLAERFDARGDDDSDICRKKIETFFAGGKSWASDDWPSLRDEEED